MSVDKLDKPAAAEQSQISNYKNFTTNQAEFSNSLTFETSSHATTKETMFTERLWITWLTLENLQFCVWQLQDF